MRMSTSVAALLLTVTAFVTVQAAPDLSGAWTLHLDPDFGGNKDDVECSLAQNGNTLAIRCGQGAPSEGRVDGRQIIFGIRTGRLDERIATFAADLDASATGMIGAWHLLDENNRERFGKFTATKPGAASFEDGRQAYRPGSGVTLPRVLRDAKPQYTAAAMRAKIQGAVLIECIVASDGTVTNPTVIRSLDSQFGLDDEALKAARAWRFAPGTKDGQPVSVIVTIELTFTLGK